METGLLHLHSLLRWVALVLIVVAVIKFFSSAASNKSFTSGDKKLGLFTLITFHLQLVIGLLLYFMSNWYENFNDMATAMSNDVLRFYTVEHTLGMIIAIAFVTIGYSSAKRTRVDSKKFKKMAWWFLIALIIVLVSIPWPFREIAEGKGWF
jgi:heme A synthase